MTNRYQIIDESTWKRAMHCAVFRNSVEPAFCVTFELDITDFLQEIREQRYSFTLAMVYAVCRCANEIEEFRYRFLDGKVVLYERIDTAFTYLDRDTELFKVVNVPMRDTLQEYVRLAAKTANEQTEYFTGLLGNDVFQCSPMPWVSYTHISHTNSGKKDNATPLFDWGKYFERDGKILMPVSVQAHHSFVDGLHVGRFAEKLQKFVNEYPKATEVTAAVIYKEGKLLVCQRPERKRCGLLWEFPGGKVEKGETPEECLVRECREELGITIEPERFLCKVRYEYPDITVEIRFYMAQIAAGTPSAMEHRNICWCTPKEVTKLSLCPADEEMIRLAAADIRKWIQA